MNQVLEFLAENYIYVAGGSAIIIVILLLIIAFGNKKSKKSKDGSNNGVVRPGDFDVLQPQPIDGGNGITSNVAEPVLESVPVMNSEVVTPVVEPVTPVMNSEVVTPVVEPVAPVMNSEVVTPVVEPVTPVMNSEMSNFNKEKTESLEIFDL